MNRREFIAGASSLLLAKPKLKDPEEIHKFIDNYWMNLGDTSQYKLGDPLKFYSGNEPEKTCFEILKLSSNPEYFYFTCKYIFNIELLPFQCVILDELWKRPFPMLIASRGGGKTFILALYAMLRAFFKQGRKIVIIGGAFRQAKYIWDYCGVIWDHAPILRDIMGNPSRKEVISKDSDRCMIRIGESRITALPLGTGEKIRGERAQDILTDEFDSVSPEIYEKVVAGFASVSQTPIENVKLRSKLSAMEELGLDIEGFKHLSNAAGNQSVVAGTASYDFRHFAKYWKRYKAIIESIGDPSKLNEVFGEDEEIPEGFDWKDYSIIRIPVELIPKGFMDEKHVAKIKSTVDPGIYRMEMGAIFSKDSHGFFKGSLINSCTTDTPIVPAGQTESVQFEAKISGQHGKSYVFGIDPASERDNFAISIIELCGSYRKLVYCWTTTRKKHRIQLRTGLTSEGDYYSYCVRKIRDLMKVFPCEHIGIDSQGGGITILEGLHDVDKIKDGEKLIWEIIEDDNEKDTDHEPGLHIVEMVNFADYKWLSQANFGLKKDMQDKVLLLPRFDSVSLGIAAVMDESRSDKDSYEEDRIFDSLEDTMLELEDLKKELATIKIVQLPSGRDKWTTPEVLEPGGAKVTLRKDRYTALLIANMLARQLNISFATPKYKFGGSAQEYSRGSSRSNALYTGPGWANINGNAFTSVIRRK